MSEKEIISLDRQIAHSYAINRRADLQFQQLVCTSFSGRLKERLEANGSQHLRWKAVRFASGSVEELVGDRPADPAQPEQATDDAPAGGTEKHLIPVDNGPLSGSCFDEPTLDGQAQLPLHPSSSAPAPRPQAPLGLEAFAKSRVVYLSADSPNVLSTIEPEKVYVIGAIVDHNRYKNLCLDLATQLGFGHAQLPIGGYMTALKTRKVLTVNQVFEILVKFIESNDWKDAFEQVIPSRKL